LSGCQGAESPVRPTVTRIVALLAPLTVLMAACTGVIYPPAPTATRVPTIAPPPTEVLPTPTPEPEQWVKNHRITEMWSGPAGQPGAVVFSRTSSTFCSFRIIATADDARMLVYNPFSSGELWIDAEAVGPVVPPEHRPGPKPRDQNCAEAVYDP
jgi:hypothetical protein